MPRTASLVGRRPRTLAALIAVVVGTACLLALPAAAYGQGQTTDGYCVHDTGVTVVVDASVLDGGVSVRCVPDAEGISGLEALKAAGFEVTGTRRYGEAFVCRIDNRPSPRRELALTGDDDYREQCINTVPTAAMWSYWHAENGGGWAYSHQGPKSRTVRPGGFEGWSFALNAPEGGNPPGVDPVRDGAPPPSGQAPPDPAADETAAAPESDGGSVAPWAAAGAVVLLGSFAVARRRRARGSGGT